MPSIPEPGEITDKGYVNQRRVLTCRTALVEMLYTDQSQPASSSPEAGPDLSVVQQASDQIIVMRRGETALS